MHFSSTTIALLASAISTTQAINIPQLLKRQNDPSVDTNTSTYYLGYRGADFDRPWSKYFNATPVTFNAEFLQGLADSPHPSESGVLFSDAPAALSEPGYLALENGYTTLSDGSLYLTIRSDVPETFTGEQYDFWFSWHVNETSKYKLWNPAQHQYSAVNKDQIAGNAEKPNYRSRYWNLTSFIDEFIGTPAYELSVGFFNPIPQGFELENATTGIETIATAYGLVGAYQEENPDGRMGFNASEVILTHQVRKKPTGSGKDIRSRFWFGAEVAAAINQTTDLNQFARDMSTHCAREMTHLGTFLPALFEEFKDDIAVATN